MKIAIRKEPNGLIYIDKTAFERFDEEILKQPPYNYSFIEVEREDFETSDFNDDLTFNIDKYNDRKKKENAVDYEQLIISKFRERYTIDQELAILRQRDTKPQEFFEYNAYVEQCKAEAKEVINAN